MSQSLYKRFSLSAIMTAVYVWENIADINSASKDRTCDIIVSKTDTIKYRKTYEFVRIYLSLVKPCSMILASQRLQFRDLKIFELITQKHLSGAVVQLGLQIKRACVYWIVWRRFGNNLKELLSNPFHIIKLVLCKIWLSDMFFSCAMFIN